MLCKDNSSDTKEDMLKIEQIPDSLECICGIETYNSTLDFSGSDYSRYGSKINTVIKTLRNILQMDDSKHK